MLTLSALCAKNAYKIHTVVKEHERRGAYAVYVNPWQYPYLASHPITPLVIRKTNLEKILHTNEAAIQNFINEFLLIYNSETNVFDEAKETHYKTYMFVESSEPFFAPHVDLYAAGHAYHSGMNAFIDTTYDTALREFEKALEISPALKLYSDIYYFIALCYVEAGMYEKARDAFKTFYAFSEKIAPDAFKLDIANKKIDFLFYKTEQYLALENEAFAKKIDISSYPHLRKEYMEYSPKPFYSGFSYAALSKNAGLYVPLVYDEYAGLAFGGRFCFSLNHLDIIPSIIIYNTHSTLSLAIEKTLFKGARNNFALSAYTALSLDIGRGEDPQTDVIFAGRISASYFFTRRIAVFAETYGSHPAPVYPDHTKYDYFAFGGSYFIFDFLNVNAGLNNFLPFASISAFGISAGYRMYENSFYLLLNSAF